MGVQTRVENLGVIRLDVLSCGSVADQKSLETHR